MHEVRRGARRDRRQPGRAVGRMPLGGQGAPPEGRAADGRRRPHGPHRRRDPRADAGRAQESRQSRREPPLRNAPLIAACLILAACDKAQPSTPVAKVAALPSFASASGGTLLQVPAGAAGQFYIDAHPVTQEIYQKVMGVNPSKQKNPQAPVAGVQWVDAVRFCNKSSEMEGLKPCYDLKSWTCDVTADGYRLPTEAEW